MPETYGEEYYRTVNYVDYLSRGPRYEKVARELDGFFFQASIGDRSGPLLDFGCATGHLVRGFRAMGYGDVHGYDVSEWAVDHGNRRSPPMLTNSPAVMERAFHMVTAFDVFEHIDLEELGQTLATLKARWLVLRVPVLEPGSDDYPLEVHRRDPTHVVRMNRCGWDNMLEDSGWTMFCRLGLHSVWDSPGVFSAIYRTKSKRLADV